MLIIPSLINEIYSVHIKLAAKSARVCQISTNKSFNCKIPNLKVTRSQNKIPSLKAIIT